MPSKNPSPYFSHDADARDDIKHVNCRMEHGWEAYGLFWAICEMLRQQEGTYRLECDYNAIAYNLRADASLVQCIVENYDLFIIEDGYFYSETLIERMKKRSKNASKAANKRWENHRLNASAVQTQSERNADAMRNDANKVKKSKVKKSKDIKHKYGEFKLVLLSDEELSKLNDKFGAEGAKYWIRALDEGLKNKNYKYKDHYLTILQWERRSNKNTHSSSPFHTGRPASQQRLDLSGYDKS